MRKIWIIGLCMLLLPILIYARNSPTTTAFPNADYIGNFESSAADDVHGLVGSLTNCAYNTSDTPFDDDTASLQCKAGMFGSEFKNWDMSQDWTICFFIKVVSYSGGDTIGVLKDGANDEVLIYDSGGWTWHIAKSGGGAASTRPAIGNNVVNGSWVSVCTKRDDTSNSAFAFLNGALGGQDNDDIGGNKFTRGFTLCAQDTGAVTNPIDNCMIDGLVIWNTTFISNSTILTYHLGNFTAPASPPGGALNVTITHPSNSSGYNSTNLSTIRHKVWINGTHNQSSATWCGINDTRFHNLSVQNGANAAMGWNFTYVNNTYLDNANYWINVSCNVSGSSNGSDVITFTVDIVSPTITPYKDLSNNATIVWNGTLITQINFSDNLEIYFINVSLFNRTVIFNRTNVGVPEYALNISYGVDDKSAVVPIYVEMCDAHTHNKIKDVDRIDKSKGGIKYVIDDNLLWLQDDYIFIYPKDYGDYETADSVKLKDRYTQEFNKKSSPKAIETFIVESNHYIDITKLQLFGGHLVLPSINYWVDLENDEAEDYVVRRIDDYKIEIDIYGLKSKKIKTKSIGELNCIEDTYWYVNLNPIETHIERTTVGATNNFILNVTRDDNIVTNLNATLHYNGTLHYGGLTENYTLPVAAPSLVSGTHQNISFNWVIDVDGTEYNLTTRGQNVSNFYLDNCSTYKTVAMNFTMINMSDDSKLQGTMEFNIDYYTSGANSKNFNHTVTAQNETFCIFPEYATIYTDLHVDYYTSGSNIFTHIWNDTAVNNVSTDTILYVTHDTTLVTFTVKDSTEEEVSNVEITILEWDIGTGTFKTASELTTDHNGEAFGYLNLYDTWYKFILVYEGRVVLDTSPTKITTTSVQFTIYLDADYYAEGITSDGVYSVIDWSNSSLCFTHTWNELELTVSHGCMSIWKYIAGQKTSVNSSCVAGGTGSSVLCIGSVQADTYVANGYVVINDIHLLSSTNSVSFDYGWKTFGQEGVFVSFLIVLTLTMFGIWKPAVAIIMMLVGVVGTNLIGFYHMNIAWLMSFIMLGIIAIVRLNKK